MVNAMSPEDLHDLARRCGIGLDYLDATNTHVTISDEVLSDLLRAMHPKLLQDAPDSVLSGLADSPLPAVYVAREGEAVRITVDLPSSSLDDGYRWQLRLEGGGALGGHVIASAGMADGSHSAQSPVPAAIISLGQDLEHGYHQLTLLAPDNAELASIPFIVAPAQCFQQQVLRHGNKLFGLSLQLYSVRSCRNWGIGDFTDLLNFVLEAASAGVDIVGLNPIHALFPANPASCTPYSPSNRAFINVLYIDPEAVSDYAACDEAQRLVGSAVFVQELERLRGLDKIDYEGVARAKFAALQLLFNHFQRCELGENSGRAAEFLQFVESGGEALRLHAVFDALHEHLAAADREEWGWPVWPVEYKDPYSSAVQQFSRDNASRIRFFQYLQWCASQQIMAVQEQAIDAGMAVGVYLDLAVGTSPGGSETWANQQLFCFDANAGAPPDELATQGQDWGFPPFEPTALRSHAYDLFARNLRANMVCAGAVRFDHCVSLLRLWWIPHGNGAREGAYVEYQINELTAVLALESHRQQCLVIGEDLGTVPEALPRIMEENAIFCYRVLYFEMEHDKLVPPEYYPRHALATINTHDVAPLASWWDVSDIELRVELNVLNDPEVIQQLRDRRYHEKTLVLNALHHYGYMTQFRRVEEVPELTREVNEGLHLYLAGSRAAIMISQLEDWMHMYSPVNVPGTFREYDNWQRKLDNAIEDFFELTENSTMLQHILEARAKEKMGTD